MICTLLMQNPNYNFTNVRPPQRSKPSGQNIEKTSRQLIKERNLKSIKTKGNSFESLTGVNPFDPKYEPEPQMPRHDQRKVAQRQFGGGSRMIAAERGFNGVVQKPTYFLVGERGPERVSVVPLRQKKQQSKVKFARTNKFTDTGLPGNRLMNTKLPSGRTPKY